MAALASPEVGLLPAVDKDEECDKDSGHHSGEEMDIVITPESQVIGPWHYIEQIQKIRLYDQNSMPKRSLSYEFSVRSSGLVLDSLC